jgi:hypothetical protein
MEYRTAEFQLLGAGPPTQPQMFTCQREGLGKWAGRELTIASLF